MRCAGALALIAIVISLTPAAAQDQFSVSSCAMGPRLPVSFAIDCSHVADPAQKKLCQPFLQNTACRVFPAYREITGLKLESFCPAIKYTIYDKDKFPYHEGEGGLSLHCTIDYMAEYSIGFKSAIGPYDVHEILHQYHALLGALPDAHVLFGPSMTEATRRIGDDASYEKRLAEMKAEAARLGETAKSCKLAELAVEDALYLENPKTVSLFYLKLPPSQVKDQAAREARFNRMFETVAGGKGSRVGTLGDVRQYLIAHGCAPF